MAHSLATRKKIAAAVRNAWRDTTRRARWEQSLQIAAGRPDVRQRKSAAQRKRLSDAAQRQEWDAALQSPKARERRAQGVRRSWKDAEKRQRRLEGINRVTSTPEWREKVSKAVRQRTADPTYREQMSQTMRVVWADPKHRRKATQGMRRAGADPGSRKRKSESMVRIWVERNQILIAAKAGKRGAAMQEPKSKGGRHKKKTTERAYFKIGEAVDAKLCAGKDITAARRLVAKELGVIYATVVRAHKRFRKTSLPGAETSL